MGPLLPNNWSKGELGHESGHEMLKDNLAAIGCRALLPRMVSHMFLSWSVASVVWYDAWIQPGHYSKIAAQEIFIATFWRQVSDPGDKHYLD